MTSLSPETKLWSPRRDGPPESSSYGQRKARQTAGEGVNSTVGQLYLFSGGNAPQGCALAEPGAFRLMCFDDSTLASKRGRRQLLP